MGRINGGALFRGWILVPLVQRKPSEAHGQTFQLMSSIGTRPYLLTERTHKHTAERRQALHRRRSQVC